MNYSSFDAGEIVLVDFRFSDQIGHKLRPAMVITPTEYNAKTPDIIVLKITSTERQKAFEIGLNQPDLESGILKKESVIRTDCPLVIEKQLVREKIAKITKIKLEEVKKQMTELYQT